jgi:hypothetical protein
LISAPSRSLHEGKEHEPGVFLGALVVTGPHHGGNHGWPADHLPDGALAPPVTSFATSKDLSRSVDANKARDMTLAGGASLNDGIFLTASTVDKALRGSMAGERMNKSFGGEVRGRG